MNEIETKFLILSLPQKELLASGCGGEPVVLRGRREVRRRVRSLRGHSIAVDSR